MSVRVMAQVWELDLLDSEKIVLLALADSANDEGHCWPGMKSLVRKCSKTDRTIQGAIQALCDKGHLSRREVPGKGCNYTVHPRSAFAPEQASPPKGTTQTPEAASDKPLRTIRASEAKASSAPRAKFPAPQGVSDEQWQAFRDQRKKRINQRSYTLVCNKLQNLADAGWPPGDMIDLAIERGWETVFEPRKQRYEQPSNPTEIAVQRLTGISSHH